MTMPLKDRQAYNAYMRRYLLGWRKKKAQEQVAKLAFLLRRNILSSFPDNPQRGEEVFQAFLENMRQPRQPSPSLARLLERLERE